MPAKQLCSTPFRRSVSLLESGRSVWIDFWKLRTVRCLIHTRNGRFLTLVCAARMAMSMVGALDADGMDPFRRLGSVADRLEAASCRPNQLDQVNPATS